MLALFHTRSLHECILDYAKANKPAARKGKRVWVSRAAKRDLKDWRRLVEGGRAFV